MTALACGCDYWTVPLDGEAGFTTEERVATHEARHLVTNDDPSAALCTLAGDATAEHDYRAHTYAWYGGERTSWRCVWCHTVACGDYGEADPCWLPYHHFAAHRSRAGVVWPLGGNRA